MPGVAFSRALVSPESSCAKETPRKWSVSVSVLKKFYLKILVPKMYFSLHQVLLSEVTVTPFEVEV